IATKFQRMLAPLFRKFLAEAPGGSVDRVGFGRRGIPSERGRNIVEALAEGERFGGIAGVELVEERVRAREIGNTVAKARLGRPAGAACRVAGCAAFDLALIEAI